MVSGGCVAHAQARDALPFVNADARDPWNLPLKTADKLAIRRLFAQQKYAELTAMLEQYEAIAEANCALELVGYDAFDSFRSAQPAHGPLYDAYVAASPDSYAPLVARGIYNLSRARKRRGTDTADKTTGEQWTRMRESAEAARRDLVASIEKHPTLIARVGLIDLNMLTGVDDPTQLELGLKACPSSLLLNAKALNALQPRWGGSRQKMTALIASLPIDQNPRLQALRGALENDLGIAADADAEEALRHFDRAIEAGGLYWEYLFNKSYALLRLGRYEDALVAVDQAALQRPQKPRIHVIRWALLGYLGRSDESNAAAQLVNSLDPFEPYWDNFTPAKR